MKTLLVTLSALFALAAAPQRVGAFELQGDWPEQPERVTLSIENEPTSRALRRAAESAGLDLVATLPSDPPCTVHVRRAPLPDVLSAILGEQSVVAQRSGRLITVRARSAASAPAAALPVPTPPVVPTAPTPPTPPVPPSMPVVLQPPPVPASPAPPAASEQPARDRVTFTGDIVVRRGERVRDVVTMGGDARIEGEVTGDVVTMGGDIEVVEGAIVRGDLVTMGGDIEVAPGGSVQGERVQAGDGDVQLSYGIDPAAAAGGIANWFSDAAGTAARYALLFLLGLVMLGVAPERLETLRLAVVKVPTRAAATGVLGFIVAVVLIIVLCITLIGIPAAVLLALALPVSVYVGMAATASVIGALLPVERLKGRPVLQLAAGIALIFGVSLLPFLGGIVVAAAAVVGFGAVVITRFGKLPPGATAGPVTTGPYR